MQHLKEIVLELLFVLDSFTTTHGQDIAILFRLFYLLETILKQVIIAQQYSTAFVV